MKGLVGDEDRQYAGGSYVVTQKYLHTMSAWKAIGADEQERFIGRTKVDNIELDDDKADQNSHKNWRRSSTRTGLNTISSGTTCRSAVPATVNFGTYFTGYSRHLG